MKKIHPIMAILGVVPFIGLVTLQCFNVTVLPSFGSVPVALSLYSLLIITFLCGSYCLLLLVDFYFYKRGLFKLSITAGDWGYH
jgi:hypothetical protein